MKLFFFEVGNVWKQWRFSHFVKFMRLTNENFSNDHSFQVSNIFWKNQDVSNLFFVISSIILEQKFIEIEKIQFFPLFFPLFLFILKK